MKSCWSFGMAALVALPAVDGAGTGGARSPEAAHAEFQVDPGLRIELVAAEPLVASPCAIAWDSSGAMFVVENRGYPTGMPDGRHGGRIVRLMDSDGDGRMDRRVVFAEDLSYPNGLMPWKDGLIVTCAPDILFLRDRDGDERADERRVLLSGFDTSGSTQLRVAHPVLGPDGWIYLTSGLSRPGMVSAPERPERVAVRVVSDTRFDPETLFIQAVEGRGQFGQSFDDWGNRFHCMNRIHIQHSVISSAVLSRNPGFQFTATVENVPEGRQGDFLRGRTPLAARVHPISGNVTTADSHAGTFSAACGVLLYRGDALPDEYYGNVFTCEPTGNLVHRDLLTARGPTFSSRMANEGREFLASPDDWFRPVFLASGPDGALYVCDMYRETIEHPEYLPEEIRKRTDFDAGRENGRIWRVTRAEGGPARRAGLAGTLDERVKALGHSNGWHRDTAHRLLVEARSEAAAAAVLAEQLPAGDWAGNWAEERHADPLPKNGPEIFRANALNAWAVLARLGENGRGEDLSGATAPGVTRLLAATRDSSPGVRLAAWRWLGGLAEEHFDVTESTMAKWAADPHPAVRFQVAIAFGNWQRASSTDGLAAIGRRDGRDVWMRAALLSGLKGREGEFLRRLVSGGSAAPELMRALGELMGKQGNKEIPEALTNPEVWEAGHVAFWGGFAEGARGGNGLSVLRVQEREELAAMARRLLTDRAEDLELRFCAVRLVVALDASASAAAAGVLFSPVEAPELQQEFMRLIGHWPEERAAAALLAPEVWERLGPRLREQAVNILLSRRASAMELLKAIRDGSVLPHAIAVAQRAHLRRHADAEIRKASEELFNAAGADRMRVVEEYRPAAAMAGDAERGRGIFKVHCANCHRLDRDGFAVGPDLFGMRTQPKETILLHILDPNYEVVPAFAAVWVETSDNRELTGIVASETESGLTLRQALGIEEVLARGEIARMRVSGTSLMPEGFEQLLGIEPMADLLSYLRGEGVAAGR